MNTVLFLKLASLSYLGLLAAGILMPGVVGLRRHLFALPTFIRQLFWVYYAFIGLSLICFGLGTFFLAEHLASGTPLARAVCGFLALFLNRAVCIRDEVSQLLLLVDDGELPRVVLFQQIDHDALLLG